MNIDQMVHEHMQAFYDKKAEEGYKLPSWPLGLFFFIQDEMHLIGQRKKLDGYVANTKTIYVQGKTETKAFHFVRRTDSLTVLQRIEYHYKSACGNFTLAIQEIII